MSKVLGEFLDPLDALFTSGYSQELFVAIIGAVTAWGIIDGVIYVLIEVFARRERYRLLQYIQTSCSTVATILLSVVAVLPSLLLSDFEGVNLSQVSEIALLFDQADNGALFMGDLELVDGSHDSSG